MPISMCLILAFALFTGCNRQGAAVTGAGTAKETAQPTPTATTEKPERRTFSHKIEGPGEIHAYEQTPMYARISGYVARVHNDIGDRVKLGDTLAELDVPEMVEELKQKAALVLQAKAELERARKLHLAAEADLKFADAKVKEAGAGQPRALAELGRAQSQYERLKKTPGVLSEDAIAETKLGFEAARAAVVEVDARIKSAESWKAESEAKVATAHAEIAVAAARLAVADASVRYATEMLRYTKLSAPFPGRIIKRHVDTGHFVQATGSGAKGEPLFVVARLDPVRIFVDVPENDAALIADKLKAVIRVQALKGESFVGAVKRSSVALDPKGRILRAEIDLANPDEKLRPGMYTYATIAIVHDKVLSVAVAGVFSKDDQTFCCVREGDKVRRLPVLVGFRDSQHVELVKKGRVGEDGVWLDFTGDEEIVTSNPARLQDGQAVNFAQGKQR